MSEELEATTPVDDEPVVAEVAEETPEPELDADGNPVEPEPDDDSEEIEYDGKTFKGPKGLKDAILRQADYTQKTQAIAEERKALASRQAEIAQQAEAQNATLEQRVQLAQVDASLEQYQALDWGKYETDFGPGAVATAMAQWRQLEAARGTLAADISTKETEHRLSSERITASALQEAEQALAKEIPGFGAEMVTSVAKAASSFGFTPDEIKESFVGSDGKADLRTFKFMAEFARLQAYETATIAKTTKAAIADKQAKVTPAATVSTKGGGYKPGLDDSLPLDEWNRRRDAQIAKARGR